MKVKRILCPGTILADVQAQIVRIIKSHASWCETINTWAPLLLPFTSMVKIPMIPMRVGLGHWQYSSLNTHTHLMYQANAKLTRSYICCHQLFSVIQIVHSHCPLWTKVEVIGIGRYQQHICKRTTIVKQCHSKWPETDSRWKRIHCLTSLSLSVQLHMHLEHASPEETVFVLKRGNQGFKHSEVTPCWHLLHRGNQMVPSANPNSIRQEHCFHYPWLTADCKHS